MLKENIQLLEESTTVSDINFVVSRFPRCLSTSCQLSEEEIIKKTVLSLAQTQCFAGGKSCSKFTVLLFL